MRIAILGAPCNNRNLGCMALTYSLIHIMDNISMTIGEPFEYYVFEAHPDDDASRMVEKNLNLQCGSVHAYPLLIAPDPIRFLVHYRRNYPLIRVMKSCDLAIDMTQGDSFTDIYGEKRFKENTNIKYIIEKIGVPLILGPQTYGPFNSKSNIRAAKRAIEKSILTVTRDNISSVFIKTITKKNVYVSSDLAFQLPYKSVEIKSDKTKVGVNISGLLVKQKTESTITDFSLNTNYDLYIENILDYLCKNDVYDVYLIPHVMGDCVCNEYFHERFPKTKVIGMFDTPMEAKSIISQMDLFIGSRMHATIAGVSSNVPTIPVAYSRKFKGVFDLIKYNHLIDLQVLSTEDSVNETIKLINDLDTLKYDINESMEECKRYYDSTERLINQIINSLIK